VLYKPVREAARRLKGPGEPGPACCVRKKKKEPRSYLSLPAEPQGKRRKKKKGGGRSDALPARSGFARKETQCVSFPSATRGRHFSTAGDGKGKREGEGAASAT